MILNLKNILVEFFEDFRVMVEVSLAAVWGMRFWQLCRQHQRCFGNFDKLRLIFDLWRFFLHTLTHKRSPSSRVIIAISPKKILFQFQLIGIFVLLILILISLIRFFSNWSQHWVKEGRSVLILLFLFVCVLINTVDRCSWNFGELGNGTRKNRLDFWSNLHLI